MKYLLIFFLTTVFVLSCSKNNDESPEPIELNKNHIMVAWPFYQDTIKILSPERECFVKSNNSTIADAIIKNDSIIVSAYDFGSTKIDIYDQYNNSSSIEVSVIGFNTEEVWLIFMSLPQINDEVSEDIKEVINIDVREYFKLLHGFNHKFNTDNSVTVFNGHVFLTGGTYSIENKTLNIELDSPQIYPSLSTSFQGLELSFPISDENKIIAYVDCTEKYKEMYPDSKITNVTFALLFMKKTW